MMRNVLLTCLGFTLYCSVFAQQVGSFQLSVDFQETDYNESRELYIYVPENYDPSNAYKLLVGFRGGPNSNAGQFRDQLRPLSDSLNAIILCPENSGHFWNNEGLTKQLFQYSLDTTVSLYNIDMDYIYLTGLSYGGRHAVIVSMDTDDGPIPKLRGVIPFAAGSEADLQPDYENIDEFPPACICIGLSDSNNFINVANKLHNDIQNSQGLSLLNEIPGVGHTVDFNDFPSEMMECFNFIEAQYEANYTTELLSSSDINISPNPSYDFVFISLLNENEKIEKTKLFDLDGKLLTTIHSGQKRVDISNYVMNRVLILHIHTSKGIYIKKIITKK